MRTCTHCGNRYDPYEVLFTCTHCGEDLDAPRRINAQRDPLGYEALVGSPALHSVDPLTAYIHRVDLDALLAQLQWYGAPTDMSAFEEAYAA